MSIRLPCLHAIDIGRPGTVKCRLALGGGMPHAGFCCGCALRDQRDVTVAEILHEQKRRFTPHVLKSADVLKSEGLTVDLGKRAATLKGRELALTTTEFEVLSLFLQNAGNVLSRDRIMDHLRGIECDAFNRSIDITVSRLRKKLGDDPNHPRFFKTVWGAGYLFIGKVASRGA